MKTRAFTLIELLVVISIIAVLMAVLMPALRLARQQAGTSQCLSNVKNLSLGWYMYMSENDSRIMSSEDNATLGGSFVGWIGVPRDENGTLLGIGQTDPEVQQRVAYSGTVRSDPGNGARQHPEPGQGVLYFVSSARW